jgi:hypothetical protein
MTWTQDLADFLGGSEPALRLILGNFLNIFKFKIFVNFIGTRRVIPGMFAVRQYLE